MSDIIQFLIDLLGIFFGGIADIFVGLFQGIITIFNLPEYFNVFSTYSGTFDWWQWIIAIFFFMLIVAVMVSLVYLVIHFIIILVKRAKTKVAPQDLIEEIASLNRELHKVSKEKDRILNLKMKAVSGGKIQTVEVLEDGTEKTVDEDIVNNAQESRFSKLTEVDQECANLEPREYTDITLPELCEGFRNYACSQLKLYYDIKVVRLFFSGLATTRLLILQGISGTGKTSLPYAIGRYIQNRAIITPVQPSWRDRTELFGYFNEFTKRFNETEVLKKMYEARYYDDVYITVLDEMNIARVEYYFAELLSILEMPSRDNWIVDLVPSGWANDPKLIEKGRFKLPQNMWYVGTANNDDSTFAISDKVYDRAIPININDKGRPFDAPYTTEIRLSATKLEKMFAECQEIHQVSEENIQKLDELDNYVIQHFRLAFGNRIVKQLKEFIPVYIGCGGTELDGIDYVLANKIFRKFESLNLSYIRDEIDDLIDYLDRMFGRQEMAESKEYLARLKKLF